VEEGRRGGDDDTVGSESLNGLPGEGDGSSDIGLPDVTAVNETKGEDQVGGLDSGDDSIELSGLTGEVNMETSNGELGYKVKVVLETAKVGGQDDLG